MFSIEKGRVKSSCENLYTVRGKLYELSMELDSCIAAVSRMKGLGEPQRFLKKCKTELENEQREVKNQGYILERILYCYEQYENRILNNADGERVRYKVLKTGETSIPEMSEEAGSLINSITL